MATTPSTLTGLDTLRWLADHGARFCKVSAWNAKGASPGKKAFESDWPEKPYTIDQVRDHLASGGNVGLLTGSHSGGICILDVDQDYSEYLEFFPGLAAAPAIIRAGANKGKILIRIEGVIPPPRSFRKPGETSPFYEVLTDGRQGVAAGIHPSNTPYQLINAGNEIPVFQAHTVRAICRTWTGQELEESEEPHQKNGDGLREAILSTWTTLKIFEHFGRAGEVKKEHGELRLLKNGGLLLRADSDAWYCHADQMGGGPFEAWWYCMHGNTNVPKGRGFYDLLLCEMATAGGIPIPQHNNGHSPAATAGEPPEEPPDSPDLLQQAPITAVKTWADLAQMIGPVEWEWKQWLPKGMLIILAGESGAGKSGLALRVAAGYLRGDPWPDGTPFTGERGAVLWCEAEAAQAVNLERAKAWGLPTELIYAPLNNPTDDLRLDLPEHRAMLASRAALPEVRLIIIDSLRGVLGRGDENASETLNFIKWLAELARDTGKPIILTHHLRKRSLFDTEGVELERLRGSSAIVQTARVVWALDVPDLATRDNKRLSVIKSNLAKFPEPVGMTIDERGIQFGDAPQPPKTETVADKAVDLLLSILGREPVLYDEIEEARKAAGISEPTINRAKKKLGVISVKTKDGWQWALPAGEDIPQ